MSASPAARILLVADESAAIRRLRDSLERLGYEVCCAAATRESALQMAGEFHPALALVDVRLRDGVDGAAAAEELSRRERIPVIALSADSAEPPAGRLAYRLSPYDDRNLEIVIALALERHALAARLGESEQRYRAVWQQASEGIVLFDPQARRILAANPAFERLTGYAEAELRSLSFSDLLHHSPQSIENGMQILLQRGSLSTHLRRFRCKDGRYISVEAFASLIAAGGGRLGFASMRDITPRIEADEALRASQRRYHAMFENSPIGLWEEDFSEVKTAIKRLQAEHPGRLGELLRGSPALVRRLLGRLRVLDVNQTAVRTLGASDKETLLNNLHRVFLEDSLPIFIAEMEAIAAGASSFEGEGLNATLDGRRLEVQVRWTALPGYEESLGCVLVSVVDLSESRQREREMAALAELSAALRPAASRSAMLPILLDQLHALVGCEAALGLRLLPGGGSLVEHASGGWVALAGERLPPEHPFNQPGPWQTNGDMQLEAPWLLESARHLIYLPLVANQAPFGGLALASRRPFSPSEQRILTAIAEMAANALQRAALHEQSRRNAEQMAAVSAITRSLAEMVDLPGVYSRLGRGIISLLPQVHSVEISLYDPAANQLTTSYLYRPLDSLQAMLPPRPLEDSSHPYSRALATHRPQIISEMADTQQPSAAQMCSSLYAPILFKGRAYGVLLAQSMQFNAFTHVDAELLGLVASTAGIAIENARLFGQTERRLERLSALHMIDAAIASSLDLRLSLEVLINQTYAMLRPSAVCILLADAASNDLVYAHGQGFASTGVTFSRARQGEGLAGQAALSRSTVQFESWPPAAESPERLRLLELEEISAYTAVPLIAKGQVKGVLEIFHRGPPETSPEWFDFLETLAGQAAIAIDNTGLFEDLQRSNQELMQAYDATLAGWSRALDLRDHDTEDHTQNVTELTVNLAQRMGFDDAALEHVRRGALLHDIGKLGIPDSILLKPSDLTEDEWAIMRRHPGLAHSMLQEVAFLRPALEIPYYHHERWDGSGYPQGLKGDEIPLAARIFAVVDVWEALSRPRPYRKAWPRRRIWEYIQANSGAHFDPEVVAAFESLLRDLEIFDD